MKKPDNSIFIIFGGTGDLTKRKIIPALFQNFKQNLLPEQFKVLGLGRTGFDSETYRNSFSGWLKDSDPDLINRFLENIHYQSLDINTPDDFIMLRETLTGFSQSESINYNYIFYLAVGPNLFAPIVQNIGKIGLCGKSAVSGWRRLIVEKPFGYDLDSARKLNQLLLNYFYEDQIYRIDHYLGKETVQNILAFRFANGIFEPLWNRNYISHVEIISAEKEGVGSRGGYYEQSGQLRDMVQNHLLQLLAIVAMEPPNNFESKSVRDEKLKIFEALAPIDLENLEKFIIRGQYRGGTIGDKDFNSYRDEDKVDNNSMTETFIAMKTFINNWRWSGVPFYIRTGKRLQARVNEIVIHFKQTPHLLFQNKNLQNMGHNMLILRIQPKEGIVMKFGMKKPGEGFQIHQVNMDFHYSDLTDNPLPDAYEKLLLDALIGDPTLFARNDSVEACWIYISPVLTAWNADKNVPLYKYPVNSWGPAEAEQLFENSDITWHNPCSYESKAGDERDR